MSDIVTPENEKSQRLLVIVALALAVVTVVAVIARLVKHGTVEATSWALPLLIVSNLLMHSVGRKRVSPGVMKAYNVISVIIALVIIYSLIRHF